MTDLLLDDEGLQLAKVTPVGLECVGREPPFLSQVGQEWIDFLVGLQHNRSLAHRGEK